MKHPVKDIELGIALGASELEDHGSNILVRHDVRGEL